MIFYISSKKEYQIIQYNSNERLNECASNPRLKFYDENFFCSALITLTIDHIISDFSARENTNGSQIAKFIFILCLFKSPMRLLDMCVFFLRSTFFCGQLLNISHPQLLGIGKSKRKKKTERNRNDHIIQNIYI